MIFLIQIKERVAGVLYLHTMQYLTTKEESNTTLAAVLSVVVHNDSRR